MDNSVSTFKSFKCSEVGHKANEWSKPLLSKGRALILKDVVEDEEEGESGNKLVEGDEK